MHYETFVPPPPLDAFIENLWYWRDDGGGPANARDRIMASGSAGLHINLTGDPLRWFDGAGFTRLNRLSGIALGGPNAGHFAIDAHLPHMLGVQFRPGGTYAFFGAAGRDFLNAHIDLADLWGAEAASLQGRLIEAVGPRAKFQILLAALAARFAQPAHHPAVAQALHGFARRPMRVAAMAAECEISEKRLIALFTGAVGFTPKLFQRVSRFQRLLGTVWPRASVDWAEEAFDHGYYDQAHLIHEFRQFSGLTPNEYLRRRGTHLRHVPLAG